MLTTIQSDIVAHVERLRTTLGVADGQLAPAVVGPYTGQLLHMQAGLVAVPALWVDVEAASLDALTEGGDVYSVEPTVELVLAAQNGGGHERAVSDGVALASWGIAALLSEPIAVAGYLLRPVGPLRFRRIASDETYWAGALVADLQIDLTL